MVVLLFHAISRRNNEIIGGGMNVYRNGYKGQTEQEDRKDLNEMWMGS